MTSGRHRSPRRLDIRQPVIHAWGARRRGPPAVASTAPLAGVTLLAVDGATTADASRQFSTFQKTATHSCCPAEMTRRRTRFTFREAPWVIRGGARPFSERLEPFEAAYRRTLESLAQRGTATVCTIYNGAFEPDQALLVRVALMMFNDVILRAALEYRASVHRASSGWCRSRRLCQPNPAIRTRRSKDRRRDRPPAGAKPGEAASHVFAG